MTKRRTPKPPPRGTARPATATEGTSAVNPTVPENGVWRRWLTRGRLEALLVALLAFAVYANILPNGFVDDDEAQVLRNPWIRDFGHLKEIFGQSVWSFLKGVGANNYYRPLMHVTYLVTLQTFGLKAWGFHLVSLLLHIVNSVLVYRFACRLAPAPLDSSTSRFRRLLASPAFAAGLLFAAHPVHTEAVAWIASVPELTFTLFSLVALLLYLPPGESRGWRLAGAAVAFFLALLCKETAIVVPALCLLGDVCLRPRERWLGARLQRYALFGVALGAYVALRLQALWSTLVPIPKLHALSGFELAINVLPLLTDYLRMLLVPAPLSFWHAFRPITSLWSVSGLLGLTVAAICLAALAALWRRNRRAFLGLAIVLVPLVPAFWIAALPMKPFAERYLYFPSVGFALLIALALERCPSRWRTGVGVALGVTLIAYSWVTVQRNRVWESAYTLFSDTVRRAPEAQIPRYDLALALANLGRVDEAIVHYRILLEQNPQNAKAHSGLGAALLLEGRTDEAIERLRRAIELEPTSLESYNDLAVALKGLGRREESVALYRRAIALDPEFADAHFNLGSSLSGIGQSAEALGHYREAVRLRPENAYYRAVFGIELADQGRLTEAVEQFEEAVRLAPEEIAYRNNLERARRLLTPAPMSAPPP